MKIVIADDNSTDRLILKRILSNYGYDVFAADDGEQAIELYKTVQPDLVLLDALMPNMDGYDAATEIKRLSGDKLIPIIFLTSLTDASELAHCLEVGGDDFLTKPYNKVILEAKIKAFERMKSLHDELREKRNEIQRFNDHMIHEQEIAKRLFDNIAHGSNLNRENIRYLLSPMSIFNGDILLVDQTPSDLIHIMLGDFTGHGLPAAIGALPVADIFYGMTAKGFSIVDIVSEINSRLSNILPVGVFCCATLCEINYREQSITSWSGGLPNGYIVRHAEGIIQQIVSRHLPLGVLSATNFSVETEIWRFQEGDKLYLFSDGILEAESPEGEMFGDARLEQVLNNPHSLKASLYDPLIRAVNEFTQESAQSDDYTLIEYRLDARQYLRPSDQNDSTMHQESNEWCLVHEFRASSLCQFDPLPMVLQILNECPGLKKYRGRVFTILAELFTNALEHGVLGLDSNLKRSADGFTDYYHIKKQRLDSLREGFIRIRMEHIPTTDGGNLHIRLQNSGEGFDTSKIVASNNKFYGRGLALVQSLCDTMEFSDNGKQVDALYKWRYK